MAVTRPILLALAGLVLIVGVFVATRGAGNDAGGGDPTPPAAKRSQVAADKPSPPAASKTGASRSAADTPSSSTGRAGESPLLNKPGPRRLMSALARGNLVVLFVRQPGASDDRKTARSVAALRRARLRRTTIASVPIRDIGDYTAITGTAGVKQAPSIVIARAPAARGGGGALLEGYVDPGTLRQRVVDVRGGK